MATTVECTDCGTKYAANEQSAGKRVRCRKCGNVFVVPATGSHPAQAAASPVRRAVGQAWAAPGNVRSAPPPIPRNLPDPSPVAPDDGQSLIAAMEAVETTGSPWAGPTGFAPPGGTVSPPGLGSPAYAFTGNALASKAAGAVSGLSVIGRVLGNIPSTAWPWLAVGALALASFLVPSPFCYVFLVMLVAAGIWVALRSLARAMARVYLPGGAAIIVLLRIGLRLWIQYGDHHPASNADDSPGPETDRPPISSPIAYPVAAPSPVATPSPTATADQTAGGKVVNLEILADGYPGDINALRNRIAQSLRPRLLAAGIGVDPAARIRLVAGVERVGSKSARITQYANANRPLELHHEIQVDEVIAKLSVIDSTGAVVFERHLSPGFVDGRRMIKPGDDETAIFSRMQWDNAAGLVDSLELPLVLEHPAELPDLRERLGAAIKEGTSGKTREEANHAFGDLIAKAGSLHAAHPDDRECNLTALVSQLQVKIAALPSEEPAASVFQEPNYPPLPNAYPWKLVLGDELTFKGFAIRPPRNMTIDLHSNDIGDDALPFHTSGPGQGTLVLRSLRRADRTQKQPWLITLDSMAEVARDRGLFAIKVAPDAAVTPGRVNGIDFTWITPNVGRIAQDLVVRYVALDGDNWFIIELSSPNVVWSPTPESIRRLKPGETRSDPLSPQRVAAQLGVDDEAAEPILIRQGAAAEDAVLAILGKDVQASVSAAKVLQSIGTAKSVPALKAALHSRQPGLPAAAHAALHILAPHDFDAIAEAILNMGSTDAGVAESALKTLAAGPADSTRKAAVEPMLELLFASGRQADPKNLGTALALWRTDKTVDLLLKALGDPKSAPMQVEAAMGFAAAAPDKRLVFPVVRWINTPSGDRCVECLIAMGPMVEAELLKITRYDDDIARANAAKVLAKVGTPKAIPSLTTMSRDPRYPTAADAAGLAILEIQARAAAAAATQPAR